MAVCEDAYVRGFGILFVHLLLTIGALTNTMPSENGKIDVFNRRVSHLYAPRPKWWCLVANYPAAAYQLFDSKLNFIYE